MKTTSMLLAGMAAAVALAVSPVQAQNNPIKVGALLSFSGGGVTSGASAFVGLRMKVKEMNDAGGLLGRQLVIVQGDDKTDPTAGVSEAIRLVTQEKVDFMIGPQFSQICIAATPTINQAGIAWISTCGALQMNPTFAPRHFANLYTSEAQAISLVNYANKIAKVKSVAIMTDNTTNSKDFVDIMTKEIAKTDMKLTGTQEYELNSTDMTPQWLSLRRGNPDLILFSAITADGAGHAMKSKMEIGWDVRVVGSSVFGVLAPAIMRVAGPNALKTALGLESKSYTYCTNDPVGQSSFSKFQAELKKFEPANFEKLNYSNVIFMYDGMGLLAAATKAVGSTDGTKIAAWLEENVTKVPVVNGPLTATKTSHWMIGADLLVPVQDLDQRRSDGLLKRAGC